MRIRGAWATINGREVFMASKIKRDHLEVKVRLPSDGTFFWTLPRQQLGKEKACE